MKFIVANHINDRALRPRLWRIPTHLYDYPITPKVTKAQVQTQRGPRDVCVLKVLEKESNWVFDEKSKQEICVSKAVERFYE